jgi:membrane protease YdiL (CAAX protease family)
MSFFPDPPPAPPPVRRGHALVAWLVILAFVALVVWRNRAAEGIRKEDELTTIEMQGRYLVGVKDLLGSQAKDLYKAASADDDTAAPARQLRQAVLAGELAGPGTALDELEHSDFGPKDSDDARLARDLQELYRRYDRGDWSGGMTPAGRQGLVCRLGWFGELALAPAGAPDQERRQAVLAPARRSAVALLCYAALLLMAGTMGLVLGVTLFVLWVAGRLRGGVSTGSPFGGIYAEAFAVYLLLFLGLGYLLARFPFGGESLRPLRSGLAVLGALAAVAWPVLRGVSWRRVREEIGWTAGRQPALEPLLGVGVWAAALPLVLVGVVTYFVLTLIERHLGVHPSSPSHPIVGWLVHSDWWVRLQVAADACVLAPLVEETMFRGFLYRHLREATSPVGAAGSVLFSALVSGLVFAIIHPQGVLFVPVLLALAVAFALAREWRGTLVPPMVAHAITNGLALLLVLLAAG